MILSFPPWNPLLHQRGCETMSSLGLFPHPWHHTTSSLFLQNAWRAAEEKRKHAQTALSSSSSGLARLAVLSLAFAIIPSLSPSKFQSTPLPEAPIYLNRWDQNFCTSQSAVAAEPAYKAIQLQVSIKNVQWGISGCRRARATQQPFLELRCWQSQKQRSATL